MRLLLPTALFILVLLVLILKVDRVDVHSENKGSVPRVSQLETIIVEPVLRPVVVSGYGTVDVMQRYFLYSQVQGEVTKKVARDGEVLREGDVLLRLNSDVGEIQLQSLKAVFEQRKMEYQASKELRDAGYLPEVKLSSSLAGLKKAEADLKALEKQIEKHVVRAPVSGILGKINVAEGDVVTPGVTLLAELIPFGDYIIRMNVSETDILTLREGLDCEVVFPDIGVVTGKTKFISLIPSSAGKMFPVEIHIKREVLGEKRIPIGSVVDSRIIVDRKLLYKVPGSVLFPGTEAKVVMTVVEDSMPRQLQVELVEEEGEGFWIWQDSLKGEIEVVVAGALGGE